MDSLGFGVIGCGNMGASLARGAASIECASVVCVSDVDENKGRGLAAESECDFEADYRKMLTREDVCAVLIATPGFLHEEPAIAAAESGVHIFSEKPMSPTLSGCDRMTEAANAHGVRIGVGLVCRYHPVHRKIRDIATGGKLGSPTCIMVHRLGGGWGGVWTAEWRMVREKSGGNLMEVNAHEIDFMRFIMGDVQQVYAVGGQYVQKDADFPDIALVSLNFANGSVGVLHSSMASTLGGYGGRLDCSEGSITFPSFWGADGGLRYKHHDKEEVLIAASDLSTEEDPVTQEIRAFAEAVLNGEDPPVGPADGRAATEIALAAYHSIESGTAVSLPFEES
jgi:predicted dehydrogenase